MSLFRILYKFTFMISFALVVLIWLAILQSLRLKKQARRFQTHVYRLVLKVWNTTVTVKGTLAEGPSLLVANHCSYIDIFVLGSLHDVRFTPKSEIRRWPFAGPLITLFDPIYIERNPSKAKEGQGELLAQLSEGGRMCVFPESTTNNGRMLKPFKSTLFSVAEIWPGTTPLPVQPVTLQYRTLDGQPIEGDLWDDVAYYDDDMMGEHMLRFFRHRALEVTVICHPPIFLQPGESRKELAKRAESMIAETKV